MQRGDVVAGKYRLIAPLGSGGMAEVWSATNAFTERQVAIKFMNEQVAKTPEAAARFLKEAKVSARIDHPNIIDVLDVGQTEQGQLFLVMELLTGYPLEVALRRRTPPMRLDELATVMLDVAEALAAAHRSGIVHRDLKPTNIFLHQGKAGTLVPKLLDFGVSKFLEEDTNHALTVAGTVLGSPLYMSPEQARGESNVDGRTDVFAFGAILFEALCGYRAYEAKNFNALIVKIATTPPKSIDACAPQVPEALRRVVRRCMEPDLERRPQTFDEIVAMLREALPELEASGLRLPKPALADPDATNALAVAPSSSRRLAAEPSDRPQQDASLDRSGVGLSGSVTVPPGMATHPGSASGASSQTPNTSYASIAVPPSPTRSHAWGLAAVGAALVVGGIGIGALFAARRPPAPTASAPPPASALAALGPAGSETTTTSPTAAAGVAEASPAPTSNEPPTVSVNALPGASIGAPDSSGRLDLAAAPGRCTITIDGKERGVTPLAPIDLPAGTHQVLCTPEHGRPRAASVTIAPGATSTLRFALDD